MIISATLSKPTAQVQNCFGKKIIKIKLTAKASSNGYSYYAEEFTKTQVFHEHFTEQQMLEFLEAHAGKTFKSCVKRTENEEITILANKKGKITELKRAINNNPSNKKSSDTSEKNNTSKNHSIPPALRPALENRRKNYIIQEGTKVPFLMLLGIMNDEGKVISSKYDKFRQINRYLEFIDDILPEINLLPGQTLKIADFGCGKSYLTFAVHYFLCEIKKIPCNIVGLDLKKDVIEYCNQIAAKLKLNGLKFRVGNIADYSADDSPDIVITLHACDTATDFALKYAVSHNAKVILSVPCCQHQINQQLSKTENSLSSPQELMSPLLKWGIIREKFSSLLTDALRGEWLEQQGYKVQMLEFIDIEHTPKNILIRAVKKNSAKNDKKVPQIIEALNIKPEIFN
ncbi:MAG: SAM-dependent methyltransferase [Treponema sp.]|nr:SAM-dependent methyltransferase [Treponema sp.]